MEKKSSIGQGLARNPRDSVFIIRAVSLSKKILASSSPREEEKRKTPSKTTRFATKKRTGLPVMSSG
jgi:hypothetical protein